MSKMSDKIKQVVTEAEALMTRVFAEVPEKYRPYIDRLEQSKKLKVGGEEGRAYFEVPYIGVDGRVAMANDEHVEAKAKFELTTHFNPVKSGDKEYLVCLAIFESPLRGRRFGHAIVPLGKTGFGPEATNPFEVGETSAIGRALGFAGYGLIGSGIASLEEVQVAEAIREEKKEPQVVPDSQDYKAKAMADPLMAAAQEAFPGAVLADVKDLSNYITQKQANLVKRRLRDKGVTDSAAINQFCKSAVGAQTLEAVQKEQMDDLLRAISEG